MLTPGPAVPVYLLAALTRPQADDLRQVELIAFTVIQQEPVAEFQDKRVLDQVAAGRRAHDQSAGASRLKPGEGISTIAAGFHVRIEFSAQLIEGRGVDQLIDNDGALLIQFCEHGCRIRICPVVCQ